MKTIISKKYEANQQEIKKTKKYKYIYYYDDSGDNVQGVVEAMKKVDVSKTPKFVIASAKRV